MQIADNDSDHEMKHFLHQASDRMVTILSNHWRLGLPCLASERTKTEFVEELRDWLAEYGHLRGQDEGFDLLIHTAQFWLDTVMESSEVSDEQDVGSPLFLNCQKTEMYHCM